MKKFLCFLGALLLILSGNGCDLVCDVVDYFKVFEVDDVAQYGTYITPKYASKDFSPDSYIVPFFPEKIEDFFDVQKYSYKYCIEPPMIEAFLEIAIEDETTFQNYVHSFSTGQTITEFSYEAGFKQIVFSEVAEFHALTSIGYTDIRKILFSDEKNTVIFLAIEMPYNDCPLELDDFSYFNRFEFDFAEYAYILDNNPTPYEDLKRKTANGN